MGAGDHPPNGSPAGQEPYQTPGISNARRPSAAMFYDGRSRDFPLQSNGQYTPCHPVDQRVELAVLQVQGSMACAPEQGSKIFALPRGNATTNELNARDILTRKLAPEVDAGNIVIEAIRVETPMRGAVAIELDYKNLRLPAPTRRTVRAG